MPQSALQTKKKRVRQKPDLVLQQSTRSVRLSVTSRRPPAKPVSPFIPKDHRQFLNLLKVGSSLGWSLLSRKAVMWGKPMIVNIEPTSICNLHCPLCPSGNGQLTRRRSSLNSEQYRKIIDRLPSTVRMVLLWNQGEPFLVKELPEMIRYSHRKGQYVVTSTNGHFIRHPETAEKIVESGLDEIIISLDGVDQSTYSRYRKGGNIETVFDGVRLLAGAKQKLGKRQPCIHLQFILMKQNLNQRESMIQMGRRIGADKLSFKTLQLTDWDSGKEFLPDSPELTRYDSILPGKTFTTRKRRFFPNECLRLWYSLVVNCDGTISPCCFDKDGKFILGNLLEDSFDTIWKGQKYQDFRQSILNHRYGFEMCKDCSEGLKNLFISTINYHDGTEKP